MFALHPQLKLDTFPVTDLKLSSVLLMNNRLFPWLILVPRIENIREIIELPEPKRGQLMEEIASVSSVMKSLFNPYKLNVAALGNQVEQLHIHVIARFREDVAWPNPVWGSRREAYADPDAEINRLKTAFLPFQEA
jgi:diadenosine tetraphosphate (Ap4A) HIT family hydrolase